MNVAENKTGPMLREWLERNLGKNVRRGARGFAHGGTCLTLHGLKDTTKDVDFAFEKREDFDQVRAALQRAGYKETQNFGQFGELQIRLENPQESIDVIDLRHPTWNHWTMQGTALRGCVKIQHGNFELLQPDVETIFVFKTYPCRPSDLQDLKRIVEKTEVRWDRVETIFREQESYAKKQEKYAPGLLIAYIRGRAYASIVTLRESGVKQVDQIAGWARDRWNELGLPPMTAAEVLALLRRDDHAWARFLDDHAQALEKQV